MDAVGERQGHGGFRLRWFGLTSPRIWFPRRDLPYRLPYSRAMHSGHAWLSKLRAVALALLLGVPALALLIVGPRRQVGIPAERTVVQFWAGWTGVEAVAIARIVEQFNRSVGAEKKIWVDYHAVSDIDKRMLIATAGGDPADLATLFDRAIPQFADQEALTPLDELVTEHDIDLRGIAPIWLDLGRYQGKLYGLPAPPYTIALFYNKHLFRDAGLDPDRPPRTIAELDEYAARLTQRDPSTAAEQSAGQQGRIQQLGFTASRQMMNWWHWVWPCFFGAQLWDGQRARLDSPEAQAGYQWIADSRARYGTTDLLEFEGGSGVIEGAQNPFLSGRLAMLYQGPWLANWALKYTPDLDFGVAPFPSSTADGGYGCCAGDLFVIPRGAPHAREAMVFLTYLMRQDVIEQLAMGHAKLSPYREPLPGFFEQHPNPHIRVFARIANLPRPFGVPQMPAWPAVNDELMQVLDKILAGRDPQRVLSEAQARVDHIVQRENAAAQRRRR